MLASSFPTGAPSTRNCTPRTPTLSDAFAERVIEVETTAPSAGAPMATVGKMVSALATVTLIAWRP